VAEPGLYVVVVGGDEENARQLQLNLHDVVFMEWVRGKSEAKLRRLPLAEVRKVSIARHEGLTFKAETGWPGAVCDWSVSGGTLVNRGDRVVWQPPASPGRYLVQVIADWGIAGLAVDAVVLVVDADGSVSLC
jgi:hypothetical protein